ncbi:alpha/beta hydrolase [Bacillus sp. DTU_2020_1000418_1_SI_GHA_SEK_038]|uniref:alpha/beta fold hydrolase n=1 Tax=Bacillus sp. DTU_2020_1000418_1_SI_GHA_SEK_038 TaxID=3077585 RepID=UPI0028E1894B|nr:alpha/beta hydrolase [Bacillus sp. DTU_2020_1000418_1_SI_GHA_SEK_038]WNS76259.1 alpha/beta hydrolase [Bacillus sp. DTU_2020_1000418_1_SI_GHA_SEK_038]
MIEERIHLENDIKINVNYSVENKEKPTILLIHFSGGTSQMWNGVIPYLQNEYRIIAPDLRGHGKSDRPLTGYHIDDFSHDLFLLLHKLGINKCHVVGSSLGAEVGLSLAASHPDMVMSLVNEGAIYNEFGEYGLFNGEKAEIEAEKERLFQQLNERELAKYQTKAEFVEDLKAPLIKKWLWNDYFRIFFESCAEEQADGSFEHFYKNHVRTEYIQKYCDIRFEDYYKRVKCPVLFLPSEKEWGNPKIRYSLDYFSSLLDEYEVYRIEGSIHAYVWMQHPIKAGKVIKDFLEKLQTKME